MALVAMEEELFFRILMIDHLEIEYSRITSVLVSSLIFLFFHLPATNLDLLPITNILLGGILLGIVYLKTRSIWPMWGFHFSWNSTQSLLGFNVSGKELPSVVQISPVGHSFVDGGNFGYEASFVSCVLLLFTIILLVRERRNKFKVMT